jgi:hypothetical protein
MLALNFHTICCQLLKLLETLNIINPIMQVLLVKKLEMFRCRSKLGSTKHAVLSTWTFSPQSHVPNTLFSCVWTGTALNSVVLRLVAAAILGGGLNKLSFVNSLDREAQDPDFLEKTGIEYGCRSSSPLLLSVSLNSKKYCMGVVLHHGCSYISSLNF